MPGVLLRAESDHPLRPWYRPSFAPPGAPGNPALRPAAPECDALRPWSLKAHEGENRDALLCPRAPVVVSQATWSQKSGQARFGRVERGENNGSPCLGTTRRPAEERRRPFGQPQGHGKCPEAGTAGGCSRRPPFRGPSIGVSQFRSDWKIADCGRFPFLVVITLLAQSA